MSLAPSIWWFIGHNPQGVNTRTSRRWNWDNILMLLLSHMCMGLKCSHLSLTSHRKNSVTDTSCRIRREWRKLWYSFIEFCEVNAGHSPPTKKSPTVGMKYVAIVFLVFGWWMWNGKPPPSHRLLWIFYEHLISPRQWNGANELYWTWHVVKMMIIRGYWILIAKTKEIRSKY